MDDLEVEEAKSEPLTEYSVYADSIRSNRVSSLLRNTTKAVVWTTRRRGHVRPAAPARLPHIRNMLVSYIAHFDKSLNLVREGEKKNKKKEMHKNIKKITARKGSYQGVNISNSLTWDSNSAPGKDSKDYTNCAIFPRCICLRGSDLKIYRGARRKKDGMVYR